MAIRTAIVAAALVLGTVSPVLAQSALPPCPKDQSKRYHNCFGTYTYKNGNKYTGEWQSDKKTGQGTLQMADGAVYSGQWKNDLLDGHGTFKGSGGTEYVGEWKAGQFEGQGAYTWSDGDRYVGTWKNGQRSSEGTLYRADGSVKRAGIWEEGTIATPRNFTPPRVRSASPGARGDDSPLLRVFKGHDRSVIWVARSPDGRTVLSAGVDGPLKLWDIASGTVQKTFEGHAGGTGGVAFSPDGSRAVSVGADDTLKLWNVGTRRLIQTFTGHSDDVNAVAFSPDGQRVFTASDDKTVKLWDLASGRVVRTFTGNADLVYAVAVSPDGRTVASGGKDKTIRMWDVESGRLLRTLSAHSDRVYCVDFSPDGRTVVAGSRDGIISLWDVDSGRLVWSVKGDADHVHTLAISPDGRTALSGGYDFSLKQWDLASGQLLRTFKGHSGTVLSVAFLPDGRTALSASEDKTLMLWDLEAGTPAPADIASGSPPLVSASPPPEPPGVQALAAIRPAISSETRVALVIGNSAYGSVPRLENPRRDAKVVADTLRTIGFTKVIEANDLSREQLTAAIHSFAAEADRADWAMVYFAGHGMEIGGVNYLIPVDAKLLSDRDVQFEALPLNAVLTALEGARKLRLVVLDACRNNPFASQMKVASAGRSVGRGLGRIEPDAGTLVIYAAKDGQIAQDGDGINSPFAAALAKRLRTPGMEIRRLFDHVADDVMDLTRRAQQPFTYGRLSGREDYFFVAPQ